MNLADVDSSLILTVPECDFTNPDCLTTDYDGMSVNDTYFEIAQTCEECPEGQVSAGGVGAVCTACGCANGTVAPSNDTLLTGAVCNVTYTDSFCSACDSGFYWDANALVCQPCSCVFGVT